MTYDEKRNIVVEEVGPAMVEVESETRTNSRWPSTRTYIIIIVAVVLLIAWALMMRYGGEEMSVGPSELAFKGTDLHTGDTIKVAIISEEESIWVYGTSEDMVSQFPQTGNFKYLDDEAFGMSPHEREVVEYRVPSDGTWGIAVRAQQMRETGDRGADFKVQFLEPLTNGHVRFTFIPAYLILMAFVVILVVDLHQYQKQNKRAREYEKPLLEDLK